MKKKPIPQVCACEDWTHSPALPATRSPEQWRRFCGGPGLIRYGQTISSPGAIGRMDDDLNYREETAPYGVEMEIYNLARQDSPPHAWKVAMHRNVGLFRTKAEADKAAHKALARWCERSMKSGTETYRSWKVKQAELRGLKAGRQRRGCVY